MDAPDLLAETKRCREEAVRKRDALVGGELRARPGITRNRAISELNDLIADYDEAIQRLEGVPAAPTRDGGVAVD